MKRQPIATTKGPRGFRGRRGERGLDGVGGVITDQGIATALEVSGSKSGAALNSFLGRSRAPLPVYADFPPMRNPPRVTNVGPNAASTVPNGKLHQVWRFAPDGVTRVVEPAPSWLYRGYAAEGMQLINPEIAGGPYVRPFYSSDPRSFGRGPSWVEFSTDATDVELSYLASGAAFVRWVVDGEVVAAAPTALTASGGTQWRQRLRWGLDTVAAPSVAAATGGSLAAGTYRYRVTAVDQLGGETAVSGAGSVTLAGGNYTASLSWAAPGNTVAGNPERTIAAFNIYRTDGTAGEAGTERYLKSVPATTLSFSDTGADALGYACLRLLSGTSGRKVRKYELEMHFVNFGGITVSTFDQITPGRADAFRPLFVGDSLTGSSSTSYTPFGFPALASRLLGWKSPDVLGYGGTGWVQPNTAQSTGPMVERLDDLVDTPSAIIAAAGLNDVGKPTADIHAAVVDFIEECRSRWPQTPVIVFAPWYSPVRAVAPVAAAVKVACEEMGVPYVDSLDQDWITGTGSVADVKGDGNADWIFAADKVHWTRAGHAYIARLVAQALSSLLG